MIRSTKYVFTSFCLLAQGVRATGIVKHHAAIVDPVVEIFTRKKINIVQMMCPELLFDGFHRGPCGKQKYDIPANRIICREIAEKVVWMMKLIIESGHSVSAVVGVDFSPSCAVDKISGNGPGRYQYGQGIYIEELQKLMNKDGIVVPFVGIQVYQMAETLKMLEQIL